ncbi:MAG: group 1 glycosyl transferase, partial [Lacibacter sp.]
YPAYKEINQTYDIALLIPDTGEQSIADGLNLLLHDTVLYRRLKENCLKAREVLNWQEEEKKLINFYQNIFD